MDRRDLCKKGLLGVFASLLPTPPKAVLAKSVVGVPDTEGLSNTVVMHFDVNSSPMQSDVRVGSWEL